MEQRRKIRVFLTVLYGISISWAHGQTQVQSILLEQHAFSAHSFFSAIITNHGPEVQVELSGHVHAVGGESIVRFHTMEFTLGTGTRTITARDLSFLSFDYGSGPLARAVRTNQKLPLGIYEYCFRLKGAFGSEVADEYCGSLEAEEMIFIDLMEPWDRDTIDERRPTLFWSIIGNSLRPGEMDLRMVLTPLGPDLDAQRAVSSLLPVFVLDHPLYPATPYPGGVPGLEPGRCYAWQVELLRDGIVRDRSEAWSFCIEAPKVIVEQRYIMLGRSAPDVSHLAVNDMLYFRSDEPYALGTVICEVYDHRRNLVKPAAGRVLREGEVIENARGIGFNMYEFDLSPFELSAGSYELRVRDGKGRAQEIRFEIEKDN